MPGYSQIARDLGIVEPSPFYTDAGREEGTMLSEWLLFLAQGRRAERAPDPRIAGRVAGIRKFLKDTGFRLKFGELPQYDSVSKFACKPDIVGFMGAWAVNIDCKRGAKQPSHVLQLAAQKIAITAEGHRVQKSFNLYLKNGGYSLVEQDTAKHEPRWRRFVECWYLRGAYKK